MPRRFESFSRNVHVGHIELRIVPKTIIINAVLISSDLIILIYGALAQLARAGALQASGQGFESLTLHEAYSDIEDANSKRLLCALDDTKRYK